MCGDRRSEVFVSRADDVIAQYVSAPDPAVEVTLDHRLPGAPAELAVGRGAVLPPEGALLTLRARYPDSDLAYTGVTLLVTDGRTRPVPPRRTGRGRPVDAAAHPGAAPGRTPGT